MYLSHSGMQPPSHESLDGQILHTDADAHRLRIQLLHELDKGGVSAVVRTALYEQLQQVSMRLGLDCPELSELRPSDPLEAVRDQFWVALSTLGLEQFNHGRRVGLIAIRLTEARAAIQKAGLQVATAAELRQALYADPKYVTRLTVGSVLTGVSTRCWVFVRPHLPAEPSSRR